MVVVPQRRRVLLVRVVVKSRFSWNKPVLRIAVAFRRNFSAMEMYDGSHLGLVGARSGKVVVDGKKMLGRKLVDPLDQNFLSAANVEGRSGKPGSETPHSSWFQIAMDFHLERLHGQTEVRNFYRRIQG